MEQDFYRGRLESKHGLKVITPGDAERAEVHRVIYEELCRGVIKTSSRDRYRSAITQLVDAGAQGIILGCTEITLLIGADDSPVPVFDTTEIHALSAVDFALDAIDQPEEAA